MQSDRGAMRASRFRRNRIGIRSGCRARPAPISTVSWFPERTVACVNVPSHEPDSLALLGGLVAGNPRCRQHLAAPLALSHLSYMAIMLTDVVMMGWIGADAIARAHWRATSFGCRAASRWAFSPARRRSWRNISARAGTAMGFPTAVVLGFVLDFGGPGIWTGMAVAMTGAAWLLIRRFRRQARLFAARP